MLELIETRQGRRYWRKRSSSSTSLRCEAYNQDYIEWVKRDYVAGRITLEEFEAEVEWALKQ